MPKGERFLFDVSFDEGDLTFAEADVEAKLAAQEAELTDPEEDIPTFTEEQLNAARNEGYEAGREAGIQEAGDAIETKINHSLGIISSHLNELFKRQAADTTTTFTDAVNIAVAISRKCFPYLNDTHGFPEIERMVREVLTEVLEEPRVIIYINPSLKDPLDARIKTIARESNFEGQVIALEAEDLAPGDCRISWSSGTAEREMEVTLNKITQIVESNLSSVREGIAGEVDEGVNANARDIQPTSAPVIADIGESGQSIVADILTNSTGGSGETASASAPTLVDDINALAAEIAAEAGEPPTDSALPGPEPTNTEEEAAAADTASSAAVLAPTVEESPEGAPRMPSTGLEERGLESQKSGGFEENTNVNLHNEDDIASTPPPVFDEERAAITENQMKEEPRNVEPDTNGAIMNRLSASADTEDETAFDADRASAPPMSSNE